MMVLGLFAQDKASVKFSKTITAQDLESHLKTLASDEYEGRETGKKGQKMAAKYIAEYFEGLGFEAPVDGSYFQTFDLQESQIGNVYVRKGEDRLVGFQDFIYYSSAETNGEEYIKLVVADESTDFKRLKGYYVAYKAKDFSSYPAFVRKATDMGAAGVFVFLENENDFRSSLNRSARNLQRPRLRMEGRDEENLKLVIGNKELGAWIFDKEYDQLKVGDKSIVIFNADYLDRPIETENVLGFLKGTEKPEELVIITSHYDHVGIINGEIHNGADDDGSGTVSLLEIAQAFAEASEKGKGPKRSILFMAVTGEEKGLLGSRHYTDNDPIFPLESTVVNLNIDMVGRVDDAHKGNAEYVYLIGSDKLSKELHELSEQVNKTYTNLELDYTYNDENDPNRFYYRSDHYNFAKNNIPIIFYFNGTHEDYHRPTDTVEKIDFQTMEKRAKLIFHTGWEIANREKRIVVDGMELEKN